MRRPPLITFLTWNRLGNTAISFPSLLRTQDDFEIFLIDNDSKDDTWQFLNDTKDPRIKYKKKFDQNMGVAHALNFALTHRKPDQDFINFECDFRIHNKNFVTDFNNLYKEFPEMGAVSATNFPAQLKFIDDAIKEKPQRFEERNGIRVFNDTIMGFCSYFPFETMNRLMYYDEVICLLDMDIQSRLEAMKKRTCYAMDIRTSHTTMGGNCDTCLAYHNPCEQGERKCLKYYKRIISKITNIVGFTELHRNTFERFQGKISFECKTIFSDKNPMTDEEKHGSQIILDLFKKFTDEIIEEND